MTTSIQCVKRDYLLHNQLLCVDFQVLFSVGNWKTIQGDRPCTRSTLYTSITCFQIYVYMHIIYIYIYIYVNLCVYIYEQYKQEKYHWKKLCVRSFEMFYFNLNHKENKVQFFTELFQTKSNLLYQCGAYRVATRNGVAVSEISSFFTRFWCATCLEKKVLFLSHCRKRCDVMMTSPLHCGKTK